MSIKVVIDFGIPGDARGDARLDARARAAYASSAMPRGSVRTRRANTMTRWAAL